MQKEYVNTVAARAFSNMKADNAEEFDTLGSLAGRLGDLARIQKDWSCSLSEVNPRVIPDPKSPVKWSAEGMAGKKKAAFRQHAFEQLCGVIGFPAKTMQRCPLHLAEQNVAFFMQLEGDKKVLVKTEGNEIRALLGGGYKTVTHLEIVRRLMESGVPFQVNYGAFSAKRMFVLLEDPESKYKGPDGSEMSHCTLVGNSETGEGSFFAQDLWYDYICSNRNIWGTAVRGGAFRRRHMGDVRAGLDELFGWIAGDRLKARDVAKEKFAAAANDIWTDGGKEGNDYAIKYMRSQGVQLWLARESIRVAKERWPGQPLSRFNVVSGMTKVAQDLPVDRRYEVEEMAGALFTV